ncbi:predicted protein [Nematostella vectensis]|uniref:Microbial-type PARG catalytic domain-containing protein n=1 Tax=Nematostella vectensis TaxID=45351 RepID=A7T4A1_NEMVE|nr:predicted protein [Nematostella vectensis]|eukprot:XP_001621311.1 hypothetical protein NEMVEDRAFT_v1g248697 [Nematostella vectensis]
MASRFQTPKSLANRSIFATSKSFDSNAWLEKFRKGNSSVRRELRVAVMQGTLQACNDFEYTLPGGRRVSFGSFESVCKAATQTKPYHDASVTRVESGITTSIRVVNGDCLEEALELKRQGFKPAVLNMASPKRPGGGYLTGAGAQEENLFRRTNYVQHLADPDKKFDPNRDWHFRLPEFSCVYSTDVMVFRASEDRGYAFLPEPVPMSFLAVAAYPNPPCIKGSPRLIPEFVEKCKRKIRLLLAVGLQQHHDSLVLSAWGCGAFRNPPQHIAQLFKEVLNEHEFLNQYKHISFAIVDDANAMRKGGIGNYNPFHDVFESGIIGKPI